MRSRAAALAIVLTGLASSPGASAISRGRTAHAHHVCHATHKHAGKGRACPRHGKRHAALLPVVNASQPASVTTANTAPSATQTSPAASAAPVGAEGEVQVVEEAEATEYVGTQERFPPCDPALEAAMIPCEVT